MQNHKINEKGLEQIKSFLMGNHRNFQNEQPNQKQLLAWAFEAEQHADNGDGGYIEIASFDSVQCRTQIFELTDNCFDVAEVEE
jgi:hypothetical protein